MDKRYPELAVRRVKMRWGDLDAVGHLNNTCYFRFMEQVRVEWLDELGLPIDPAGIGPVLASTQCVFRRELNYPADIRISMDIIKVGRSSLTLQHRFMCEGDDAIYAVGEVVLVWVDYQAGKSVPLPEKLRSALAIAIDALQD